MTYKCNINVLWISFHIHLKVIKKIRPDSPDVIRAAKRFEQTRKNLKSNVNNGLETIVEQSPEPTRKNPVNHQFGARSKINRCNL